eukprot:jgi/Hompol1/1719/HPOL_000258-RA
MLLTHGENIGSLDQFSPLASLGGTGSIGGIGGISSIGGAGQLASLSPIKLDGVLDGVSALSPSLALHTLSAPVSAADPALVMASAPAARTKQPPPNRMVPAFLNKLFTMVSDPATDNYIHWSEDGKSFIVLNQEELARDVLPCFFKHNNFTSFIRQLNMYGFHKAPNIQQGSLIQSVSATTLEFANENFQRDRQDLLCFVIRRKNVQAAEEITKEGGVDMNTVLSEITAIKRHQLTISADLRKMQRENEIIWNESIQLRQRYARQQETIDKVLRFLASVFSTQKKPVVQPTNKRRRLELPTIDNLRSSFDTTSSSITADIAPQLLSTNGDSSSLSLLAQAPVIDESIAPLLSLVDNGSSGQMQFPEARQTQRSLQTKQAQAQSQAATKRLDLQAAQNAQLDKLIDATGNVADDIDLLQDRLYNITSMVGIPEAPDALEAWSVDDLIANSNPMIAGSDEDHATLEALINLQSDPIGSMPEQSASTSGPTTIVNLPPFTSRSIKDANGSHSSLTSLALLPSKNIPSNSSVAAAKQKTADSDPETFTDLEELIELPESHESGGQYFDANGFSVGELSHSSFDDFFA